MALQNFHTLVSTDTTATHVRSPRIPINHWAQGADFSPRGGHVTKLPIEREGGLLRIGREERPD